MEKSPKKAEGVRFDAEPAASTRNVRLVRITPQFDLGSVPPSDAVEQMMRGASEPLRRAFERARKTAVTGGR